MPKRLPEPDLCFVADPNGSAAVNALAAIGAELRYEEYASGMEQGRMRKPLPCSLPLSSLRLTSASGAPESRFSGSPPGCPEIKTVPVPS